MRPNRWIGVTFLSTLVLGVAVGIVVDRTVLERVVHSGGDVVSRDGSESRTRRWFNKLTSELDLSPDQQERLQAVLSKNHDTAHAFWSQSRAEFDELRETFRNDIRQLLTEEQKARYDAMLAEHDTRRKERSQH